MIIVKVKFMKKKREKLQALIKYFAVIWDLRVPRRQKMVPCGLESLR